MHAVIEPIRLPGCTPAVCQTKCLDYAKKNDLVLELFYCAKEDVCMCSLVHKKRLHLTTEVMGLADDAKDDNGTFV
jgi:hypothetical protein